MVVRLSVLLPQPMERMAPRRSAADPTGLGYESRGMLDHHTFPCSGDDGEREEPKESVEIEGLLVGQLEMVPTGSAVHSRAFSSTLLWYPCSKLSNRDAETCVGKSTKR